MLETLSPSTRLEAIAWIARRPYENAFLAWVLDGGHGPHALDEVFLCRGTSGTLTGVTYFGTQLVIAAADDATADAFALETRRHPGLRSFVGPKASIDRLWSRVRTWHRAPVVARERQPVYVLHREALRAGDEVDVRQATLAEADCLIENSAQMMLGELGYDPRINRASFGAGVRRAIAQGHWWIYMPEGDLRFALNVGARTGATAQLQGVWVPPIARKRGYATRALRQIARRLLRSDPTLSLYVNDFNSDAIALYERIGFVAVGEMSTLIFG